MGESCVIQELCRNCVSASPQHKLRSLEGEVYSERAKRAEESDPFIPIIGTSEREAFLLPYSSEKRSFFMGKEAFTVSYEKVNYHRPVEGDVATVLKAREQETRNNILRYLGEYRLAVKFDEFFYREGKNSNGERFLAAGEEKPISQRFRNAISQKEKEGKGARREIAECLGFQKIEERFLRCEDFMFLWISPPGRKEDGFGDYSFTFLGEVKDKRIRIIPYRNKVSLEKHKEIAGLFSTDASHLKTDVDFLASPIFIQREEGLKTAEDILVKIGEKERIDLAWRQRLEARSGALVDEFVDAVRRNAPDSELERIKRAIENFTIESKHEINSGRFISGNLDVRKVVDSYGSYAPPPAGGSCGSSSSTLSEFHSSLNLENDKFGERTFKCEECGQINVRPKDQLLERCQHCNSDVSC